MRAGSDHPGVRGRPRGPIGLTLASAIALACSSVSSHGQTPPTATDSTMADGDAPEQQIDRDERYRRSLDAMGQLDARWSQDPRDLTELRTHLDALTREVSGLCAPPATAEVSPLPPSTSSATGGSKGEPQPLPAEAGSERPTSEEAAEIRKRQREATEGTHLPGPPLSDSAPLLAGVRDSWLAESCGRATAELDELRALLSRPSPPQPEVARRLHSLRQTLDRITSPPPSTPPVDPK